MIIQNLNIYKKIISMSQLKPVNYWEKKISFKLSQITKEKYKKILLTSTVFTKYIGTDVVNVLVVYLHIYNHIHWFFLQYL